MADFTDEDHLKTFDGWLKYQAIDTAAMTPEDLARWRRAFDDIQARVAATPKVGRMKLQPLPSGAYRYAVAVEDGADLWLVLWVSRSRKGEFFVMIPRSDRAWNVHTSYHLDGRRHMKSFGQKFGVQQRQPLTGIFKGTEELGTHWGYGAKSVGAICDASAFSGVVKVAPGVLGPRDGAITVDIVEPSTERLAPSWGEIICRRQFRDVTPWVVITVWSAPAGI
jgi:hypothetical protein